MSSSLLKKMELQPLSLDSSIFTLRDLHLDWLQTNNLDSDLYNLCTHSGLSLDNIALERSVKLDTKTLEMVSQKRYVICDKEPSTEITKKIITECSNRYTSDPKNFLSGFDTIYTPTKKHHLYVGVDGNHFKAGMDYINDCLVGIAFINGQCYYRKYNLFKDSCWHQQLHDYITLYFKNLNPLVAKAYIEAMNKCKNDLNQDVYIKHDKDGLVFHMDTRHFNVPQFDVLLRSTSTFKEKFTWISINDQLDKLTIYIKPVFTKS